MASRKIEITRAPAVRSLKEKNRYAIRYRVPVAPGSKETYWSPWKKVFAKNNSELEAEKLKYRLELEDEINQGIISHNTTFGEYALRFHEERRVNGKLNELSFEREHDFIEIIVNSPLAPIPLVEMETEDIENYIWSLLETESEDKVYRIYAKVSQIYTYAIKHRQAKYNPCDPIDFAKPEQKRPRTMVPDKTLRSFAKKLLEPINGFIVAIRIIIELGLRRGEALGLIWGNVDFEEGIIYILQQCNKAKKIVDPKCGSKRDLYMSEALIQFLIIWKQLVSELFFNGGEVPDDFPVCCTIHGDFYLASNFDKKRRLFFVENGLATYEKVEKTYDKKGNVRYHRTGYTGFTLHELRHTALSNMLALGTDLRSVMKIAGHRKIATTQGYLHTKSETQKQAAESYASFLQDE